MEGPYDLDIDDMLAVASADGGNHYTGREGVTTHVWTMRVHTQVASGVQARDCTCSCASARVMRVRPHARAYTSTHLSASVPRPGALWPCTVLSSAALCGGGQRHVLSASQLS